MTVQTPTCRRPEPGEYDAFYAEVASDCVFTVRSLLWVIAGHERHDLDVLRERYL